MTRKEQLIGELIGLARATDGNEHLRSDAATKLIRRVLLSSDNHITEAVFTQLHWEILAQKRSMVPDCFHCASPCGRTSAFDLDAIQDLPEDQQIFKHRILTDLANLAGNPQITDALYQGLILLGMEECHTELQEYWQHIIDEIYR